MSKRALHSISYVLLTIYSFILLASGLHTHHHTNEQTTMCAVAQSDTAHQQSHIMYDDCGLCKLLHTAYVHSEFLSLTRIEALIVDAPIGSIYSIYCPHIASYCLRAPPMFEL